MTREDSLATVKVFRFDPGTDQEPRFEVYQVPYNGLTVLDVLQFIYEQCDSTLSFRFGCAGGSSQRCGACAVLVNGKSALSCKRLAEKEMTIEPHPKFELVKDLVTDLNRANQGFSKVLPSVDIVIDPERCDGCRDCVRLCPVAVYEVQKQKGKAVSVPIDLGSCCGLTCRQCARHCKNLAIMIKATSS